MHRVRLLCALILGAALLGGLPAATTLPAHAAETAPKTAPARPIKGELFDVTGKLSTAVSRPVRLQFLDGGRWRNLQTGDTARKGGYRFTGVRTSVVRDYRVVAPRVTRNGRTYKMLVTPRKRVRPVDQQAGMTMLPQIAQPGTGVANAAGAKSAMDAQFRPIRKGRSVVLQRKKGTRWVKVATSTQNAKGRATFTAPAKVNGRWVTYRVLTVRKNGAPPQVSKTESTNAWGAPSLQDQFGGTQLDQSKWSYRQEGVYNVEGGRTCSKSDRRAVKVGSGSLQLSVIRDPDKPNRNCVAEDSQNDKDYWFLNGHVGTQGNFDATYGVWSARVKFQRNSGQHGSFWMQRSEGTNSSDATLSGAEIDTVEYFGEKFQKGDIHTYVHHDGRKYGGEITNSGRFLAGSDDDWWSGYHVFSVEWTDKVYIFRVDGRETFRTFKAVSGVDQHMILSLLSSDWELWRMPDGQKKASMHVDWAQVWQR